MASTYSFDIVSEVDLQEVDNAVNQTKKEITQRYDFKNSKSDIEFSNNEIKIIADDEFKLNAVLQILDSKLIKRNISPKSLQGSKIEDAFSGTVRQIFKLVMGIEKDKAKKITTKVKDSKIKVQTQIIDEKIKITGKSKDDLQEVMKLLKECDLDIPLQFTNYR